MDRVDTGTIRALRGPKGDKGDPGDGLQIDGKALDISGLPVAPEEGAQWLVVDDLYSFIDGEWVKYGPLRGPQGIPGPGVAHVGTLPPAVSDPGTLWFDPDAESEGYSLTDVIERVDQSLNEDGTIKAGVLTDAVDAAVDENPTIADHETRISRVDPGAAPTASQSLRGSTTGPYYAPSSIIYPEDFGGRGDNNFDNAAANQAAVDAAAATGAPGAEGAEVGFMYGWYRTSAPLILPRTGYTPRHVVTITGRNMRSSLLQGTGDFPPGRALIEADETLGRSWHHRITNLRLVMPRVEGTMAIWYPKVGTGDSFQDWANEWNQVDITDVLIEAENLYHERAIYLAAGNRYGTIERVFLDPGNVIGFKYNTVLLETDTTVNGSTVIQTGHDSVGVGFSSIRNVYTNPRRGGFARLFKGRIHSSTVDTVVGNGAEGGVNLDLHGSSQVRFSNIRFEGWAETCQVRLTNCNHVTFEDFGLGTPDARQPPWTASTAFTVGDEIVESRLQHGQAGVVTRKVIRATSSGTSGLTEPTWTDVTGATFSDGTVTWEVTGDYAVGNGMELYGSSNNRFYRRSAPTVGAPFSSKRTSAISLDTNSRNNVFADFNITVKNLADYANEFVMPNLPANHNLIYGTALKGEDAAPYVMGWHPQYPHITRPVVTVTTSYTADIADSVIAVNASGGARTVTLPDPRGIAGKRYTVKKVGSDTNNVLIATTGGYMYDQVVENKSTTIPYTSLQFEASGNYWYCISRE